MRRHLEDRLSLALFPLDANLNPILLAESASDMMAELKAKSSFYQQVEAQVKEYSPLLIELAKLIKGSYSSLPEPTICVTNRAIVS